MELTKSTYFSPEAARHYMSASQLKAFLNCEAAALAEIRGEYKQEKTPALLVGGFVDAHFSMEEKQFADDNPEIFKRDGTLKSEYLQATDIIDRILADPLLTAMLRGEVQKVVTGEICGVPFRGKLDSLLSAKQCRMIAEEYPDMAADLMMADGCIVDLKVMRDLSPVWQEGAGRVNFVQAWKYDLQLAIYQRLMGSKMPCYIVAVTKERVPDIALIHILQYQLDAAFDSVEDYILRFQKIKEGKVDPVPCNQCEWCKAHKVISGATDADELEGAGL
jgi:hypothetical protein